jgi:hypothetical protein
MFGKPAVEVGKEFVSTSYDETKTLLPNSSSPPTRKTRRADTDVPSFTGKWWYPQKQFGVFDVVFAFLAGIAACLMVQALSCSNQYFFQGKHATHDVTLNSKALLAPPYVGSTARDHFPPPSPTNIFPSLFPTSVGYGGGTPTGVEAAIVATAPSYPIQSGAAHLVRPDTLRKHKETSDGIDTSKKWGKGFDIFKKWGTLSPWYSVERTAFGLDSGPEAPDTCRVTGLHLLHRHGARYPTAWGKSFLALLASLTHRKNAEPTIASYGGPTKFATKVHQSAEKWNATGDAEFLNDWYAANNPIYCMF